MPGLFLSDIYYNLTGDFLGMLDPAEIGLLLPFVIDRTGHHWAYTTDPHTPASETGYSDEDDPITGKAATAGKAGSDLWYAEFSEELYQQSLAEGSLLGMPWSTKVLPGTGLSEGVFTGRVHYHNLGIQSSLDNALRFNEWSGPLLAMKMQTLGILTAVGVGGYFGGRYLLKKYNYIQ